MEQILLFAMYVYLINTKYTKIHTKKRLSLRTFIDKKRDRDKVPKKNFRLSRGGISNSLLACIF